jgi:hypothetical protein
MHTDLKQQTDAVGSRLRQIPDEIAPPYDWPEFTRRSQQHNLARGAGLSWRDAAIAATLVVGVCGVALWGRVHRSAQLAQVAPRPTVTEPQRVLRDTQDVDRSRQIESWLASLPEEPIVVRVGTRAAVAGLQDRIAQVDDLLTSVQLGGTGEDRIEQLRQERMRLVGSLAQVRYAEVVASQSP